jgi:hypothetical protein
MSEGEIVVNLHLSDPLRLTVTDEQGSALKGKRVLLVNTDQCQEFTTDEKGQVIVFEESNTFRVVVVDHPTAVVASERV